MMVLLEVEEVGRGEKEDLERGRVDIWYYKCLRAGLTSSLEQIKDSFETSTENDLEVR